MLQRQARNWAARVCWVVLRGLPDVDRPAFRAFMEAVVDLLQDTIGSIDFWQNPDKQKRVRALIKTEIAKTSIDEMKQNRERVAVEIMKLAKNRHSELTKGPKAPAGQET